jgi:hypothetical protein
MLPAATRSSVPFRVGEMVCRFISFFYAGCNGLFLVSALAEYKRLFSTKTPTLPFV